MRGRGAGFEPGLIVPNDARCQAAPRPAAAYLTPWRPGGLFMLPSSRPTFTPRRDGPVVWLWRGAHGSLP